MKLPDELVERAAKAAAEADPEWRRFNEWDKLGPVTKRGYERMAHAVVEAALSEGGEVVVQCSICFDPESEHTSDMHEFWEGRRLLVIPLDSKE